MNLLMILTLAVTHFFVLIVPGPDILLILRTSLARGYKDAIAASLGVGCGIVVWIFLTVLGLNALFIAFPMIQILLMAASCLYLLYLGFSILRSLKGDSRLNLKGGKELKGGFKRFFIVGFFTNISNPKAVLYFASVFSVFVGSLGSFWQLLGVAFLISFESICVFLLVGKIFSAKKPRELFLNNQKVLDTICGVIFIIFALLIGAECYQKIQG